MSLTHPGTPDVGIVGSHDSWRFWVRGELCSHVEGLGLGSWGQLLAQHRSHLQGQMVGVFWQVAWKLAQVNATAVHYTFLGAGTFSGTVNGGWARLWLPRAQN